MKNTSLGYHTFSFFQKMDFSDFSEISSAFIRYSDNCKDIKRFPINDKNNHIIGWVYYNEKIKGIQWFLSGSEACNGYGIYGIRSTINPKALIEMEYICAARENDLNLIEKIYNNEAERISPLLYKFGECPVNRADYCLNIDLEELGIPCTPEQMMKLIKRGNVPRHYKERRTYDEISHRMVSDPNSFYLESNSTVINYYWKYAQQTEKHPNFTNRESSHNVIRFEVQCKYPKLYYITKEQRSKSKYYGDTEKLSYDEICEVLINKDYRCTPSIPLDIALSDRIAKKMVERYFYKVIRRGDYFTLKRAEEIIGAYHFTREKEERLIWALELICEKRGIDKARKSMPLADLGDFKRSLRELDNMQVNPVTIPRGWNIKYIPNPLQAYYDSIFCERLVPKNEYTARKHIENYLCSGSI